MWKNLFLWILILGIGILGVLMNLYKTEIFISVFIIYVTLLITSNSF